MQIRRYADPQLFLDHCKEWLLRDELRNSTILSVLHLLAQDGHPFDTPFYLAIVENDKGIAGCAVRAPPDPLILSDMPLDAMPLLVEDVARVYDVLPTITGMDDEVETFARSWEERCGLSHGAKIHWRWYAVDRVVMPASPVPGQLRLASKADLALIRDWGPRFAKEIDTSVDVVAFYERRLESESLYLWNDGVPRTVAAVSGITPNSIRISGVYTAPEYRRHGYASAAVASVSQLMLDAGHRFCVLFTETSDPSANRLYRSIGYKPIFDKV
ncbi:MAG: GNAT family N-acetyltransferase, partial [Woeseiaceae bacterium]